MKFEWDEDKNTVNKEKHKISFETAAYVFDDPYYTQDRQNLQICSSKKYGWRSFVIIDDGKFIRRAVYIEMFDFEHSVDEDRYVAIGKVGDVLFVVFTERKETIRLISARLATNAEKELYYDQNIYY